MWNNLAAAGIFYAIAGLIVVFALLSVTLRNIFHSALALIVALLGIAAIYIYLDAEFLALVQVLIYVGAIMTLIIFGIMLTLKISDRTLKQHNQQRLLAFLIAGSMGFVLIVIFSRFRVKEVVSSKAAPALADIGRELLTKYALPFEVISVVLLAALIGAIVVSSKE
ncbi:NADH-quinone oxidoreductase subunit J [bacterium]|nr:MAG: NADH-quinone oxidoreductase subunit J [bacterium]